LVAFSVATTAVSVPLAFIQIAPWRLAIAGVILVTLAYFAVVDWLYLVRLAGYICIAETPDALPSSEPAPAPPSTRQQLAPGPPAQTTIDRDEPILSDLPGGSLSLALS